MILTEDAIRKLTSSNIYEYGVNLDESRRAVEKCRY